MPSKVAIVTAGASGIGLALTKNLVSKGWNVAVGDIDVKAGQKLVDELGPAVLFQETDVSDWEQYAALFKKTWNTWGRIDFHAANAGIDDKESMYGPTSKTKDGEPEKPNLITLDVDLISGFYGIRLAMHYFRKNTEKGGKIVVTSSTAGLYASPSFPQYAACKHGLVGLTRAMAQPLSAEGITINAVLPAFVMTNLAPSLIRKMWPKEHETPMSTILNAFNSYLDTDVTGQIGECSLGDVYYRSQPDYPNASQKWLMEDSGYLWEQAYPTTAK